MTVTPCPKRVPTVPQGTRKTPGRCTVTPCPPVYIRGHGARAHRDWSVPQ